MGQYVNMYKKLPLSEQPLRATKMGFFEEKTKQNDSMSVFVCVFACVRACACECVCIYVYQRVCLDLYITAMYSF